MTTRPKLAVLLREWGRLGCIGFGGPPAHIKLLRELCVTRQEWLSPVEFEDAVAACNLLPGPASTQLAIFCAWRVRGALGALLGGAAFIIPGLLLILGLAALFLGHPPTPILAAGAGAGSALAAVALNTAAALVPSSWHRAADEGRFTRYRWVLYLTAGIAGTMALGPWLVLVLLACGLTELVVRLPRRHPPTLFVAPAHLMLCGAGGLGTLASLSWVALKVGALSYGGGFVIIPLMQSDAVNVYGWMTGAQFLNAVALGQITPGPVVQTVAVVGYAAGGPWAGILAALIAFSPSFVFVLAGARHFELLRSSPAARGFLDGAGPAAIGAIVGSALILARTLSQPWQFVVLAAAAGLLFALRRAVVVTLLASALAGIVLVAAGLPLPH